MIMADIRGGREWRNIKYFREKYSWPIAAPKRVPIQEEDAIFDGLQKEVDKLTRPAQERVT